jgi:hypothetical protein
MMSLLVATRTGLLIVRRGSTWAVEQHLHGRSCDCVGVDPREPARVYCGTIDGGLFRSVDSGRHWEPVGPGIAHSTITAVAVSHARDADAFGIVYAGTEPSAVFRSENGGESWVDLAGLRALPSATTWSFPPRPETHHVRWIEADVSAADRLFVAIEGGRARAHRRWWTDLAGSRARRPIRHAHGGHSPARAWPHLLGRWRWIFRKR